MSLQCHHPQSLCILALENGLLASELQWLVVVGLTPVTADSGETEGPACAEPRLALGSDHGGGAPRLSLCISIVAGGLWVEGQPGAGSGLLRQSLACLELWSPCPLFQSLLT